MHVALGPKPAFVNISVLGPFFVFGGEGGWTNNDPSFFDLQKLNSRKAALMKTRSVKEEEKPSLRASLLPYLMSSEESDDEGTFTVRPLLWRSARATDIYHSLDDKCDRRRSIRSKMMRFARKEGVPSDRMKPPTGSVPGWCLKK